MSFRFLAAGLMAGALVSSALASETAGCDPLEVRVTQTAPTSADLDWTPRAGARSYFVSYTTGKFPTQIEVSLPSDGGALTTRVTDLRPGKTYEVSVCEALADGGCPGDAPGRACTTRVAVAAITAAPGAEPPEMSRAQCAIQPGVSLAGASIGYPYEEPVEAASVEACCELCAGTEPRLPYLKQCTAFVYYAESKSCGLLTGWTAAEPREGRTSGVVTAWPSDKP